MDKTAVVIILIVIVAGAGLWAWQSGIFFRPGSVEPTPLPPGIVLFYGDRCPHCINVDQFIKENDIENRVKFAKLEVPFAGKTSSQLMANAGLAIQLARGCNLDTSNGVGIPFLYDGNGECFTGDTDVINFFKNAANIQ